MPWQSEFEGSLWIVIAKSGALTTSQDYNSSLAILYHLQTSLAVLRQFIFITVAIHVRVEAVCHFLSLVFERHDKFIFHSL